MFRIILCAIIVFTITAGCSGKPAEEPEQAVSAPAIPKEPVRTYEPDPSEKHNRPAVPKDNETDVLKDNETVFPEGDDTVLASVNGVLVTRYDFEQARRTSLGDYVAGQQSETGRWKFLESMVTGLAIAQAQDAAMSEKDMAVLEKKVRAYRRDLLARQYLDENTWPGEITPEMIQDYYDSNPGLFGGKTVRLYEVIRADADSRDKDIFAGLLRTAEVKEDWKKWADSLRDRGYPTVFRTGRSDKEILQPKLHRLMKSLGKGETSRPVFAEGTYYVIRITDLKEIPPRPLEEVRARIRKSLTPVQLRKAIKEASARVLEQAEIIYENSP